MPDALVDDYEPDEVVTDDVSHDEKMLHAQSLLESLLDELSGLMNFDRDTNAPAHKYPPEAFHSLFAHLALEGSFPESGVRTLRWMDILPGVPEPATLYDYIWKYDLNGIDTKFADATQTILEQTVLPEPVHLAYDVTTVLRYGDSGNPWTTGVRTRHNTTEAWSFAILSMAIDHHKFILGVHPLKHLSDKTDYLRRFLRRAVSQYGLQIGRVLMDSQFATEDALRAVRAVCGDYIVNAEDRGAVSDLLNRTSEDMLNYEINIEFANMQLNRPNAFVVPLHPDETGTTQSDRDHEPFLTSLDVTSRDLRGLKYQYRKRWIVVTIIRQVKNDFLPRTSAADRRIRQWFFSTATILYNLYH